MQNKLCGLSNFIGQSKFFWSMLLLFLVILVLFNVKSIPISSANLQNKASGLSILDTRFTYSQSDVQILFNALGEEGRQLYQLTHLTLDLLFPIAYSLMFTSASLWLSRKVGYPEILRNTLAGIMLIAGVFDFLENLTINNMLKSFPDLIPGMVLTAQLLTLIKFGFFFINILILVVLLVWIIRYKYQKTPV